ncbi:unnamed protein product [Pelagomonas calceolata]|uniref:Guanylate cyclase domain-containing protein n=1 Tax=Pelagomonas calceolata TaxID=35677 RepID=A0A7S4A7B0_9STRA|nr:unnamed protein product [Pelagomonas calceolata]
MAFRLFIESSQGRRRGRRPRPQRIDDYAAHFHHHPWQDAQLALTPRLLKRLGEGVGGTADDGDESSEADAERAIASNDYVGSVSEAPRCVVLIDARGCVEEALKNCDVGAARRVILRMRRICDDAKLGETALDAHWEADQLRCSFGRCGIALAFCARVVATVGPGCRAALHFSSDAVATEYPSGRPHGDSWNVLCELVECVAADEPRCCVSDAFHDRLKREGLDDDGEAWTRIEGGYLRAPWPSLSLPRDSCDVVLSEPIDRVVVVAMVYFDASLRSTSRLYVERRRALDVLEEVLTSKGGRRAAGSDTLYIFDACVSRALDAVLASRKALEGIKVGFGVACGPVYEGVVAGSCVGVAARLCAQHGVLLSKSAAEALDPDHVSHLRTVPVFLQGSDSSGGLEEFCQVLL